MVLRRGSDGLVYSAEVDDDLPESKTQNETGQSDPAHGDIKIVMRSVMSSALGDFMEKERVERFEEHFKLYGPPASLIDICPPGPPPDTFEIGFRKKLLSKMEGEMHSHCANAQHRDQMWVSPNYNKIRTLTNPDAPFLNRLAHLCVLAKIVDCKNTECLKKRQEVHKVAPHCDWTPFRDWAVTVIACQATFPLTVEKRKTRPFFHLSCAANMGHWLLSGFQSAENLLTRDLLVGKGRRLPIDLFNVIEIIYWMMIVQASLGLNTTIGGFWGPGFLPKEITVPVVRKATEKVGKLGLCSNRLWNLAVVSERKEVDLPGLIESAAKCPQLEHVNHTHCTASFCPDTAQDATKRKQCHKCPDRSCELLEFKPALLSDSIQSGTGTAWTMDAPFQISRNESFVAISHVWADGTGVGVQKAGLVNRCLFDYLKGHILELGCNAVWWDTISIPSDTDLRRQAIKEMHHNYTKAKYTLLHDEYLVQFPWADDGSPCLALILSPWFTRGWTALELIRSKKVKIIFKGENGPVIKDLDDDVIASDPAVCTRAHWIASTIINRLRNRSLGSINDILAILKPRHTSWERDRILIAGLLVGLEHIDYKVPRHEATKQIINKAYRIHPFNLLHGQVTMADSGSWSWCPQSVYDLTVSSLGDLRMESDEGNVGDLTCLVDKNGVVTGYWYYRLVEKDDLIKSRLRPLSSDLSVVLRVQHALQLWRNCLVLHQDPKDIYSPALLVVTVQDDGGEWVQCRYVGTVFDFSLQSSDSSEEYPTWGYYLFRIGAHGDQHAVSAKSLLDPDAQRPKDEEDDHRKKTTRGNRIKKTHSKEAPDYSWLSTKLWIGDHSFEGRLLVVKKSEKTGLIAAFRLRIREDAMITRPYSMDMNRQVVSVNAEIYLSETSEFQIDPKSAGVCDAAGHSLAIKRVRVTSSSWPSPAIPANERTQIAVDESDLRLSAGLSNALFRLEARKTIRTFSALDPDLLEPNPKKRYKGIWIGRYPEFGCEFLLFHQPEESRLEAVKLTGDRNVPRGAVAFLAENIHTSTKKTEALEWPGASVVPAKVQFARPGFKDPSFVKAELVLISTDVVALITPAVVVQVTRINVASFL